MSKNISFFALKKGIAFAFRFIAFLFLLFPFLMWYTFVGMPFFEHLACFINYRWTAFP